MSDYLWSLKIVQLVSPYKFDSRLADQHTAPISLGEHGFSLESSSHEGVASRLMKFLMLLLALVLFSIPSFAAKPLRVTVTISPSTATLFAGGTKQFLATVSGTTKTAVTWSAMTGNITGDGLYTAASVSTKTAAYVTATSVADPSKKATATISVNPLPPVLSRIVVSPTSA